MNRPWTTFLALPIGPRLVLMAFVLLYPVALIGHYSHQFDLYAVLALIPRLVWHGEIWRLVSYGFLAVGPVDWAVSSFWLLTLVSVLGRNWSSLEFWGYCLLAILAGAMPILIFRPDSAAAGSGAMIFALLVAWDWFYRRERLILLGFGEISVRQAAILVAIINSLILFFCCGGWFFMVAMWGGGVAGWLYLMVRWKLVMGKTPQQVRSERVSRLEL